MPNPKPSFLKYAPSWIIYGLLRLLAQLPYRFLLFIGVGIGKLAELVLSSRKKVVSTNISMCLPDLNIQQQKQLSKQHFKELGMMVTQTLKVFLSQTKKIENSAIINGTEHLEQCLDKGHGVLLVAGHFTSLDVGGKILCKRYPIAGMYRPHKHPLTEYIVKKSRLNYAIKMFKRDELRPIVNHLKSGGILWYAPDQDYRRGQSVFAPFFGNPASTITATHQLARLSKCKVIFFHVQRNHKKPYYTLTLSEPMDNFPSKNVLDDTARVNQGIEKMVVKNPAEYLWIHKRFKTAPEGKNNPY